MTTQETRTESRTDPADADPAAGGDVPRLLVVMECGRLGVPGLRVVLDDATELVVGRGTVRGTTRQGRTTTLTFPDQEMSRRHALLRRQVGGWELTDLGSKNGTTVNGEVVRRATLTDGDLIEVGGVVLMYREEGAHVAGPTFGDRDLAAEAEAATPTAFLTLAIELERRCGDLARIAASSVPVLVRGETGTGKELVARAVHEASGRAGAFVAINCGALPRSLLESELFGYRRGAFSGAKDDRDGLVRRADGGTLFLDEIAELPAESQVALLRVLQEGEVRPIGAGDVVPVDVRVIAATHQDLDARIADGRFRQDLYARLAGFEVALPPLRERREDVGSLIAALLPRIAEDVAGAGGVTIQRAAARALLAYGYPLNVRELEQALRAAVVLADGGEIRLEHLPDAIRGYAPPAAAALRPEDRAVRERLIEVLREVHGNVAAAGRRMEKAPIQIRRWCRRFGIDLAAFRG